MTQGHKVVGVPLAPQSGSDALSIPQSSFPAPMSRSLPAPCQPVTGLCPWDTRPALGRSLRSEERTGTNLPGWKSRLAFPHLALGARNDDSKNSTELKDASTTARSPAPRVVLPLRALLSLLPFSNTRGVRLQAVPRSAPLALLVTDAQLTCPCSAAPRDSITVPVSLIEFSRQRCAARAAC